MPYGIWSDGLQSEISFCTNTSYSIYLVGNFRELLTVTEAEEKRKWVVWGGGGREGVAQYKYGDFSHLMNL